ncbi:hypothetical protein E1B28_002113 [Marasmius oreades]|uniref:F-box domain-containing protein n=1 Tax=Marasmius oreades TaxID=181124 RepID=A0A9P7RMZ6_9AGAR|nr:uncharacterized protein E1B28_002113 [Marasmius oreades]KAG7086153.1 hypothetical protein E1B28_002113 [Marasmius oreades]
MDEHQHSLLDLEYKLLHELSAIHSNINQLCPINSLFPAEILQIIFTFCMAHADAHGTPSKPHLSFTQVCRHWRILALEMPALWSTIDICDPLLASLYLSRSGDTLISLFTKRSPTEFNGTLALNEVKNRIRKIDVLLFPNSLVRLFCNIAGFPFEFPSPRMVDAPGSLWLGNLTDLTLCVPAICDPVDLSSLYVGSVRRLVLSGVRVDWGTTSSELKVLDLSRLPDHFAPTVEELFGIFDRAKQSIEEVNFEDFFSPGPDALPWTEKIETTCLRKLSISSRDKEFIQQIVLVLTTGPNTEVEVQHRGDRMTVDEGRLVYCSGRDLQRHYTEESVSLLGYRYPF